MQKRLKEIVIYILENGTGLEPTQRAQLEMMRAELEAAGLPAAAIEEAIRQVLDMGLGRRGDDQSVAGLFESDVSMSEEAAVYLTRLLGLGLIDELQREEIIERASRRSPEGVGLREVQFLAASLIFDESLGFFWTWDGENRDSARNLH
jgi:hypothetical protein